MYWPRLIGVKYTMNHGFTSNHTQDILSCHPIFFLIDLEKGISTRWGSDTLSFMQIWICYPTVARVLDGIWTISDSFDTHQELKTSPTLTPKTYSAVIIVFWSSLKTISLPGEEVIQWGPCRYGYDIPLLQESWMVHGPCLVAGLQAMGHSCTCNRTPDMLCYHPAGFISS